MNRQRVDRTAEPQMVRPLGSRPQHNIGCREKRKSRLTMNLRDPEAVKPRRSASSACSRNSFKRMWGEVPVGHWISVKRLNFIVQTHLLQAIEKERISLPSVGLNHSRCRFGKLLGKGDIDVIETGQLRGQRNILVHHVSATS